MVNQLRFRNIGGLIIIDLIDMESADHREKTYRALRDALRNDKARTNILKISELGLVEMTRKRTRENLVQTLCEPCVHCEGRGYLLSDETVTYNLLREIRNALPRFNDRRVALTVAPRVAEQLLGSEAKSLATLSDALGHPIEVRARPGIHQEQFEIEALDEGPPVTIALRWLRDPAEIAAEEEARSNRSSSGGRGGRRRGRGRRRNGEAEADSAAAPESPANEGESPAEAVETDPGQAAAMPEAEPVTAAIPIFDPLACVASSERDVSVIREAHAAPTKFFDAAQLREIGVGAGCDRAPIALQRIKANLNDADTNTFGEGLNNEAERHAKAGRHPQMGIAAAAFVGKTKPVRGTRC